MSVSIISQPTTPNVADTKLIFEISSSNINQPQYSYLMDIYQSGSNDLISRITQVPNEDGVAIFDASRIVKGQLEFDDVFKITQITYSTGSYKRFNFNFGEVYGTSTSSSLVYYPNQVTSSIGVFDGTVDPNQYTPDLKVAPLLPAPAITGSFRIIEQNPGYNFPSQSFFPWFPDFSTQPFVPTLNFVRRTALSNNPLYFDYEKGFYSLNDYTPIGINDYETFSVLKQDGYEISTGGFSNAYLDIQGRYIDATGSLKQIWAEINPAIDLSIEEGVFHIPSGPANLISGSFFYPLSAYQTTVQDFFQNEKWFWYIVGISNKFTSGSFSWGGSTIRRYINEELVNTNTMFTYYPTYQFISPYPVINCGEKTRFAFVNVYGVLDYFNCYTPLRRTTDIQRENVDLPFVDYSSEVSTYDITRRGTYNYFTDFTDTYTITTPYIDKYTADWLSEMLDSPEVFVQMGDEFVPIVITNSSYTANTNEKRQKLFQYEITFRPSKGRKIFI